VNSINVHAANNMVKTVLLNNKPFDCGSVKGSIEVIKNVASNSYFD
jgi:hypothetical protein